MELTLVVYAGSSLPSPDVECLRARAGELGVKLVHRKPIVRGDLRDTASGEGWNTRVLVLDGEFGQSLAVSVAEIREYLDGGHYIAGASSMGALRAVECRTLGMIPHGWIAGQYLSGAMDADADLALLMDPETFEPLTVPLVNVRWLARTLATHDGVPRDDCEAIVGAAGEIHYRDRLPEALLRKLKRTLPVRTFATVALFLEPEKLGTWDRKRLDGMEAVQTELGALAATRRADRGLTRQDAEPRFKPEGVRPSRTRPAPIPAP